MAWEIGQVDPYNFLTSEATIQVLSTDIVRDAQRITAQALPSNVVYSVLFAPYPTGPNGEIVWTADAIAHELGVEAAWWNANIQTPGVLGIGLSQNLTPANELQDIALVTIQSTSGKSTSQIELPPTQWLPSVENTTLTVSFPDAVRAAVAQLDAVENA